MTRSRRSLALLLVAVVGATGAACGSDGPLAPSTRRALDEARATWRSRNVRHYEFETEGSCFCPLEVIRAAKVEVRNDTVVKVTYLDGTAPPTNMWAARPTVERLFELAAGAHGEYIARVEATFDRTYGYPTSVALVAKAGIADGDQSWTARAFRVLP